MIGTQQASDSFFTNNPLGAPLQGQDSIVIYAPIETLWTLISDSTRLEDWGPPVKQVEILNNPGQPEKLGSYRRVDAEMNGKSGYYIERRVEHVEYKKMRFVMEDESFGISKIMSDTGAAMELEVIDENITRVIFSFYHRPKGIFGHLMNWLIVLRQQRKNRLLALESLKNYAESL